MNEITEGHTVKGYDVDLAGLRLALLEMGGLVLDQVQRAVNALVNGDETLARSVLSREEEVNAYDVRIEEDIVTLDRSPPADGERPAGDHLDCTRRLGPGTGGR